MFSYNVIEFNNISRTSVHNKQVLGGINFFFFYVSPSFFRGGDNTIGHTVRWSSSPRERITRRRQQNSTGWYESDLEIDVCMTFFLFYFIFYCYSFLIY